MPWKTECHIAEDWRKIELRPEVTFKVELHEGHCEMVFGLFGIYSRAAPRRLDVGEPRYSVTSEHERFLYLRGKGRVTVEEV